MSKPVQDALYHQKSALSCPSLAFCLYFALWEKICAHENFNHFAAASASLIRQEQGLHMTCCSNSKASSFNQNWIFSTVTCGFYGKGSVQPCNCPGTADVASTSICLKDYVYSQFENSSSRSWLPAASISNPSEILVPMSVGFQPWAREIAQIRIFKRASDNINDQPCRRRHRPVVTAPPETAVPNSAPD